MLDGIIVRLIVAGAAGYLLYRYGFKKSGGCGCGCASGKCRGGASPSSCGCGK